jgi:hypothetical protein
LAGGNLCPGRHLAGNEILGGFALLIQMLEIEVIEGQGEIGVDLIKGKLGGLWLNREVRVRMRQESKSSGTKLVEGLDLRLVHEAF